MTMILGTQGLPSSPPGKMTQHEGNPDFPQFFIPWFSLSAGQASYNLLGSV
jgi:hypothetical protein